MGASTKDRIGAALNWTPTGAAVLVWLPFLAPIVIWLGAGFGLWDVEAR